MRIFFDTEFYEDGSTIDLISIGMVREDGKVYYAEVAGFDYGRVSPWVRDNVLPHLRGPQKNRAEIAQDLLEFCGAEPEFWAYYCSYDWVALCQLFGTMMELPAHWPRHCLDLKQWVRQLVNGTRIELPKQTGTEHNALVDAEWVAESYRFMVTLERHVKYVSFEKSLLKILEDAKNRYGF